MQDLDLEYDRITVEPYKDYDKSNVYYISKRVIDIVFSIIGIVVLSPLMLAICIYIKISSKGNAIFSHIRLGYRGKHIKVYKFRTMVQNAETVLKNMTPEQKKEFEENFKLEYDPRVTKVGRFLRKTSLDELPQFFNILRGNMTLVGPRPIVEAELNKYGRYGKKLLSVKPGLTGLWQVSGRSDISYSERVMLDMQYIDNRSLWLDIKILFMTFIVVIKKEGAM
ncbi:lipopolysaccharide/colanic/teichoic acid biosynthesis glycosyltransferase [Clostridium acetobutylicum]|uniref:Sugar transferases n=1 Tax=Clostridium acetobutylicum (strain ATCC 824 / DSM 792 / JCM 1419 / IAM 19013 / LMG 5710 / NBRC 13948 / NRRL B-527 / VKM B-1787 / 2291 / W) TaxID=272562 RepID=Q97EP9_CLOAB|nr:sugar transferase [Clostridium acetobutylicum]AAK80999.1 Sugar transferases [Clostridium acetobutylicum ATCC 824]ADZ22102.1 Sugar transferase [Clostridium acetobutylicum EA 2018]AEI33948.1 sugar transferase [Clostridium acetobutylicum DSM 1731]PSM06550.1 sugar transferase [Clostridium sp. NJ4]AWV78590.1 sugar transferase [Clostridium acetobutylicum]